MVLNKKVCVECPHYKGIYEPNPKDKKKLKRSKTKIGCTKPNSPVYDIEISKETAKRQALCVDEEAPNKFIEEDDQKEVEIGFKESAFTESQTRLPTEE